MKKRLLSVTLILTVAGCSATTSNEQSGQGFTGKDIPAAWRNSYTDWKDLKRAYQAKYTYERDYNYASRFNSSTKFEIINDQVEFRHFFQWQTGVSPTLTWSESYNDLDSHNQGSPAKTLDQLYQQCKTEVLNQPQINATLNFVVDQFNILQECSITQHNCHSACTQGIRIQGLSIEK